MTSLLDLSQLTARTDRASLVRAPVPASPYVTDNVRTANSARQALIEARKKRVLLQAVAAMQDIERLAAQPDSLKYIEEHKVHRDIIDCLKEFQPSERTDTESAQRLQCAAYSALLVLSGRTQKLRTSIQINQDLLRHLTESLESLIDAGSIKMQRHLDLLLELLCSVQLAGPLRRCMWRHEKIVNFAKAAFVGGSDGADSQDQTVLMVRASALLLDTYYCSSSWADHVTRFFCEQHARLSGLLARRFSVEFCMRALCPLFGELCRASGEFRRRMLADGVHRQLAESIRQLCRQYGSMPELLALNVEALCRLHCQTAAPTAPITPPTTPPTSPPATPPPNDSMAASMPTSNAVAEAVRDANLLPEILSVLLRYPDRHQSLQLACFTLYSCTVDCVYSAAGAGTAASGSQSELDWLRAMQLGFLHYAHEEEITQAMCFALARLLRWRPELVAHIGDEPNQYPIHSHIRLQFANKDHKPRLMTAVLDAVFWLAVQNQRMQNLLATQSLGGGGGGGGDQRPSTEESTPMLIIGCLTMHADIDEIYYYGFRALRALCVFSKERKLNIYLLSCMAEDRWSILDLIGRSFYRFRANCLVLTEAVTLLACLADVDLIRHQCLIPKPSSFHHGGTMSRSQQQQQRQQQILQPALHKELLELLRDCQGSSREFVEAGLECLCVLAAAGFETDSEMAVLDLLLVAMQRHSDSYIVQKCGLILLQLLPKELPRTDDSQALAERISSALVGALRAFPNALGVQAEGCVAALLLCRRWPRLAANLVACDAFDCLFHIVRSSMKNRGLLRLATECLHELAFTRNQRDPALIRAIRAGHSKQARCLLELGANPNTVSPLPTDESNNSSPICLALTSIKSAADLLDTVNCLLEKGAVNTQSALEKSLALGTDTVTGLLLKHLGYYKQGNFGSITWCNLKLHSFQARWLDPVIKPRTAEQELTEVRIRKVSKLIRDSGRRVSVTSPRRRSSTAASSASAAAAVAAAASALGIDDILPERYRLIQWTSTRKITPPADQAPAEQQQDQDNSSVLLQVPVSMATKTQRQQQQQSELQRASGGSRRGSVVSLLFGRMPPFFRRADSLGEVREGAHRQQQQQQQQQDSSPVKKKYSDGVDAPSDSQGSNLILAASKNRRRTVAPEVLANQIEQFRQRRDTIRSDPDDLRATAAADAASSVLSVEPSPPLAAPDVHFHAVDGELQEFYQSTLSSSNLPFSRFDPRLRLPHRRLKQQQQQQQQQQQSPEIRRGSCLLRCAPDFLESTDAAAYVPVSDNPNPDGDEEEEYEDVDYEDDDGEGEEEDDDGFNELMDSEAISSGRRPLYRVASSQPFNFVAGTTTEDSNSELQLDSEDVSEDVRLPRRRQRRDPRSRQLRSNTSSNIGAFKPAARPEQLRLIDLSANCIPNIDSLSLIEADIDLQVSLAFLSRLSLANNKLTHLPQGVFPFLSNLAHVELNGNRLTEFPYELVTSCRLEYLDISDNDIVELREERLQWVGAVFTLRELLASRNKLHSVPMHFLENLYGLERLMLNGNRIGELEAAPLQLKRLRCLSLANNYIRAVPDEFLSCLANLEEFDASCNELEVLPSPEISRKLYHLSTVRLSNNQLGAKDALSVPAFVLELSTLKSVDLSYNSIDKFPSPRNWSSSVLREIDLSHNKIDTINLKGGDRWSKTLERFSLAYNDLKSLHKDIGLLESLASLDVSHNPNLTSLPDEVGNLSKLWEMPLDGLKLSLDPSLIRGRTKDLVGYFHQKLNKSVSHYRMKLMLVGFGGRGKTSLLRALMKQKQPERGSPPTVGIAVTPWAFRCYHRKQKWVTYRLSCWDFAGQEEFYATHQCFLSQRALYLLIYSLQACSTTEGCDAELRRLKPWLVNIKAQAPCCPVICVGTHVDTLPASKGAAAGLAAANCSDRDSIVANMRSRIEAMVRHPGFPEIADYVEVNATRDNASTEKLRTAIQSALEAFKVKGHHVMGQMVPESYVKLELLVMERARNPGQDLPVLQWYQLRKMATDAGLNMNDEKLSQAVRFLHESGVLLHFDDSTYRLNNLYFIDPQWLCRMMAQIVTVKEINGFIRSGVMRQSDLGLLFTGKRITEEERQFIFPVSQIPQYLRILEKFEIILPQKNDELLIPCRLPDFGPRDLAELSAVKRHSNLVTRLYEMPFIPIGFWSRLVARLYNIIDQIYPSPISQSDGSAGSSAAPCAPTTLEMGKRAMFAYWQATTGGGAAAAADAGVAYAEVFFLLQTYEEETPESGEGLQLQVPLSPNGAYLLAQVADNIDVVIEEWYPGLTDRTVTGECILQKSIPCLSCCGQLNIRSLKSQQLQQRRPRQLSQPLPPPPQPTDQVHIFNFDDIVNEAGIAEMIRCPRYADNGHPELVPLRHLAPDVTLSDLPMRLQLDSNRLELVQTQDHLLGQGSFGSVYRAEYNGGSCAVKIFSLATGDTPTYRLLRQESGILCQLDHPALLRMLAVGRRPYQLVLELAPMGALHQLLQQKRIRDRGLQHRLMHQVTDGLAFLHRRSIIYRDLKLDNVLVFSLSTERTVVNVKLSDYGISRFATPYGFAQPEGTPGYRAPEVINGEVYGLSADVYSLGIVLYGIVTNGRHPFENSCFRDEFDEATLKATSIDPLFKKGCPDWPQLELVINRCLIRREPNKRPAASEVLATLCRPEFACLRAWVKVSSRHGVDCMAVRSPGLGRQKIGSVSGGDVAGVDIVCACSGVDTIEMVHTKLYAESVSSLTIRGRRALSMALIGSMAIVGTVWGQVHLYDFSQNKIRLAIDDHMPDAVVSISEFSPNEKDRLILLGLANGRIAVLHKHRLLKFKEATPIAYISPDNERAPIHRLLPTKNNKLLVAKGSRLFSLSLKRSPNEQAESRPVATEESGSESLAGNWEWELLKQFGNGRSGASIYCLACTRKSIFLTLRNESRVYVLDKYGNDQRQPISAQQLISQRIGEPIGEVEARVTALCALNSRRFALGTGGGYFLVAESFNSGATNSFAVRLQNRPIRAVKHVKFPAVPIGARHTLQNRRRIGAAFDVQSVLSQSGGPVVGNAVGGGVGGGGGVGSRPIRKCSTDMRTKINELYDANDDSDTARSCIIVSGSSLESPDESATTSDDLPKTAYKTANDDGADEASLGDDEDRQPRESGFLAVFQDDLLEQSAMLRDYLRRRDELIPAASAALV